MDDIMPFDLPQKNTSIIKVVGVGGGGSNAVNYMFQQGITDVDFIICNTDSQALASSQIPIKIHLGKQLTEGLGAGNQPDVGREAAVESLEEINNVLGNNTKMVFITAGMGGGTGTGAAPVIAKAAKELGILTVAIITLPFRFEGEKRMNNAIKGVQEINKHVDSLLVINNERLRDIYGNLGVREAFSKADNVLTVAAKGIAEIITKKGYVNVDFADVQTVMKESGVAVLGSGTAEGENRAMNAVEDALNSPLLNSNDISGAKNILLNISFGDNEITMDEIYEITEYAQEKAGNNADLIWGYNQEEALAEKINVTVIATGFETDIIPELYTYEKIRAKSTVKPTKKPLNNELILDDEIDFEVDYPENDNSDIFQIKKGTQPVNEPIGVEKVDEEITLFSTEQETEIDVDEDALIKNALKSIKKKEPKKTTANLKNETNPKIIDELENVPAFKRKGINIDEEMNIDDSQVSRYTLNDDDDDELSENPFLHDNVD
jgi:cell division protein FtsZ